MRHSVTESLLHLDSSADLTRDSVTRQLTASFADAWRGRENRYRYRDVAAEPVPLVTPAYATLGRRVERHGVLPLDKIAALAETGAEEREWALTLPLIEEVLAADALLLGVPMYNFSVPASLKAWIDRVSFPGAFTDPDTGESLLRDTKVVLVLARGGGYGPGTPRHGCDFQTPYLRAHFGKLGVSEVNLSTVEAELTRAGDIPALAGLEDLAAESLANARAAVAELATG
ncbi:FMN-dependent NADH-azoreductase [Amycolatopsis sp. CA-230715]|uniref:FMN-dependent NADH-azoreductase n=1 Tax=Amycolatopsis sp. CA-230715 TaxID=2745196 RepID=UPI001C01012E|nr:NAD(P)H-dependent oxidoreductase [Amycolatopsis sp. CA-230715]QWF78805.1 FMN-dependent NADH-azoreductase [Amycolatopsis sp. CA-230715]